MESNEVQMRGGSYSLLFYICYVFSAVNITFEVK